MTIGMSRNDEPNKDDPVLCFVGDCWLYFTTRAIEDVWGDDWDDAPYEHNAGEPYEHDGQTIARYAWDGPFETPASHALNSAYSVAQINAGAVPWLQTDRYEERPGAVRIYAGWPLSMVVRAILEGGGMVYAPIVGEVVS